MASALCCGHTRLPAHSQFITQHVKKRSRTAFGMDPVWIWPPGLPLSCTYLTAHWLYLHIAKLTSALQWAHMASLNLTVYSPACFIVDSLFFLFSFISIVFFILLIVYNNKKRRCGLRDTRAEEKVCTRCYMQLRCAVSRIARRVDWFERRDHARSSSSCMK